MSDVLLVGAVLVTALACPLHMWWMSRRGKQAACCPPAKASHLATAEELRARRREIEAQLSEFEAPHELSR
mgnify:CR=1 FL=1